MCNLEFVKGFQNIFSSSFPTSIFSFSPFSFSLSSYLFSCSDVRGSVATEM